MFIGAAAHASQGTKKEQNLVVYAGMRKLRAIETTKSNRNLPVSGWERSMQKLQASLFAAVLVLVASVLSAGAGERVALVIGNSEYTHEENAPTAVDDANDIADALEGLGFSVTRLANAERDTMFEALENFTERAWGVDMALFYYAGRGVLMDGHYLVPVDTKIAEVDDASKELPSAGMFMQAVASANTLRLAIIDADRNVPSDPSSSSDVRALTPFYYPYAASGAAIVFTNEAGWWDRDNIYAKALLSHLREPGLELGMLLRKVRDQVMAQSGYRQEPEMFGSLPGEEIYLDPAVSRQVLDD